MKDHELFELALDFNKLKKVHVNNRNSFPYDWVVTTKIKLIVRVLYI